MNAGILRPIRRRLALWVSLRGVVLLLAAVAWAALSLFLLDAGFDLPESSRAAAPAILIGIGIAAVLVAIVQWRRFGELQIARRFERTVPGLGNGLTNAIQLLRQTPDTAVGEHLRREAIALGRVATERVRAWPLISTSVFLALGILIVALGAWAITVGFGHDLTTAVIPRFLDPHGDHPPFSLLRIEVRPAAADVLYGGQLELRAATGGRPVDMLWVVTLAGGRETRTRMFLAPDKSYFQTLANLREPAEYFVTDGQARSHRFPLRIRYTPEITLTELAVTYPEYTGKSPQTIRLPEEPMALPEDSRLTFRIGSNRPLRSGSVALTPVLGGKAIEVILKPETNQPSVVTGSITIGAAVAYTVSVRDVDGLECATPRRGRFNLAPDERPRLTVLEPGRNAVATPSIRIPIRVEATDDYGVSRIVWLRGHNRSIERSFSMKLNLRNGARSVEGVGAFELAKLGVRAGDVIDYYFEAADNYPKGPNLALSRIYRLEVISEEKYQEILRQTAARKALFEPYLKNSAWLRRLAEQARDVADKAREAGRAPDAESKELAEQLEHYQEQLNDILHTAMLFDVEQGFRNELVKQHSKVSSVREQLQKALAAGAASPKDLRQTADDLSALSKAEEENVGEPARQIVSVVQLVSRADMFVQLAQQQATLASMLRKYSAKTDALSRLEQMEVQELAAAQTRVRDGLKNLLTQIPELLAQVPDEPAYEPLRQDIDRFLKAVTEARIESDLADAAKALGDPDVMTGYALAQQAAVKMDKLISKCQGMDNQGQACLTARFAPKISNSGLGSAVEQILSAMKSGQGSGQGQGGADGYGLFNEDVALYGPNVQLAGEQAGGRRENQGGTGRGRQVATVPGTGQDANLPVAKGTARVRLQPDARFPLRYRDLVGDYFRAIAETTTGESK